VVVKEQDRNILEPEVERHSNTDWATTHDDDRMMGDRFPVLIGGAFVGIEPESEAITFVQHPPASPV
jgi:hypothetical protein